MKGSRARCALVLSLGAFALAGCEATTGPARLPMTSARRAISSSAGITSTITRLSSGTVSDQQDTPAISGALVAWTDASTAGGTTNLDVGLFDLGASSLVDLTQGSGDQEFLQDIDGGNVVWTRVSAGVPGDIVVFDHTIGRTTTIAASTASVHFEQASIRGRYIAFLRVGSATDVYLYDNGLGAPLGLITNDAAVQAHPRVGSDVVVYEDYGSGNADIKGYRISTGQTFDIATGAADQVTPDIDGNTVVYVQPVGGADQIFAFDLTTGITRQLTTAASAKLHPRISGSRVVWADDRNGNLDLYLYDLATSVETPLVTGAGDQFSPDIDGDRVVYTDNAAGFDQVFLDTISQSAPTAVELLGDLHSEVSTLSLEAIHSEGNRTALLSRLDAVRASVAAGDVAGAIAQLRNLRKWVDGCGTAPDRNDKVVSCADQRTIRDGIDALIGALSDAAADRVGGGT